MVVFRYLPQPQSSNRFGYEPSAELMGRLTDVRREMLLDLNHPDPQPPVRNPTALRSELEERLRGLGV